MGIRVCADTVYKSYISRCHDSMHLNDDSKSRRCALNAWRVNLNRVDVRGGQSAWDDKWMFLDTASVPRLHSVVANRQEYDWVNESFWIYNG